MSAIKMPNILGKSSNSSKKNTSKSKNKKPKLKIPKTSQQTIPYERVYKDGIIEITEGVFTKSYAFEDINFKIATDEDQVYIFKNYENFLNSLGADTKAQVSIINKNIDKERFGKNIFISPKNDSLNEYREEYNQMLLEKMEQGRNNLVREKYITLSIEAENIELARNSFLHLDSEINAAIKKINNSETRPMKLEERLDVLYQIMNPDTQVTLLDKANVDGKEVKFFDYENMKKQGLTTKDIIGPASFLFKKDYFMIEDKYARSLYLDNIPTFLSTDIVSDISDVPCNMLLSINFNPLAQEESLKMVKNQVTNINGDVIIAQKQAAKSGYSPELISSNLVDAQEDAKALLGDLRGRNQKMFLVTLSVVHFADDLEQLDKDTNMISNAVAKSLCQMKKLNYQQEAGFASALPLCNNKIYANRALTTETASVFIPFSAQEIAQKNGMYYGQNAVSKNMIMFNRLNSKNQNGVILGTPGSGKSFSAKREMLNVALNTDDDILIVDPEREYSPLVTMLGGEIVKIAVGSNENFINPFDMDLNYAGDDDPVTLKSDFICSLCETAIGGHYGLSPVQKSIIDRCIKELYGPYLEYMNELNKTHPEITFDREATPTMEAFYKKLMAQPEPEAKNIAIAIELYAVGSLNTFAHTTTVDTSSRIVSYDIKDIGAGMKAMGLQVCLNELWMRTIQNRSKGKRTWLYLDEFYLLTQTDSSARFLQQIWKRARKWGGIPTGITQNVEDLLSSKEARGIINNCDFIMMLNQSPNDRAELGMMLSISPAQMSYITNSDPGQGLIYTGKSIIPFYDVFPEDTKCYKAMTTKPDETD